MLFALIKKTITNKSCIISVIFVSLLLFFVLALTNACLGEQQCVFALRVCHAPITFQIWWDLAMPCSSHRLSSLSATRLLCSNTIILVWAKPAPCEINFCAGVGLCRSVRIHKPLCVSTRQFFKTDTFSLKSQITELKMKPQL